MVGIVYEAEQRIALLVPGWVILHRWPLHKCAEKSAQLHLALGAGNEA